MYKNLLDIKNLLLSNKIDYKKALERIINLPKPWTTKEWKEKRIKYLKPYCEICGSQKLPLVIQHTKHPVFQYNLIFDEMFHNELKEIKEHAEIICKNEIKEYLKINSEIRDACPICKKVSIRERNSLLPRYVCPGNHKFDIPEKTIYYSKCKTTDYDLAKVQTEQFLIRNYINKEKSKIKKINDLDIGKKAILQFIDDKLEYLDFKYIKTCCQKCASKEDWRYISLSRIKTNLQINKI
ncbi:MAG: hypothetical protein AB2L26_03075 [Ignavibacteria bacterium]